MAEVIEKSNSDAAVIGAEELGAVSRADDAALGGAEGIGGRGGSGAGDRRTRNWWWSRSATHPWMRRRRRYVHGRHPRGDSQVASCRGRTNRTSWCWAWSAW